MSEMQNNWRAFIGKNKKGARTLSKRLKRVKTRFKFAWIKDDKQIITDTYFAIIVDKQDGFYDVPTVDTYDQRPDIERYFTTQETDTFKLSFKDLKDKIEQAKWWNGNCFKILASIADKEVLKIIDTDLLEDVVNSITKSDEDILTFKVDKNFRILIDSSSMPNSHALVMGLNTNHDCYLCTIETEKHSNLLLDAEPEKEAYYKWLNCTFKELMIKRVQEAIKTCDKAIQNQDFEKGNRALRKAKSGLTRMPNSEKEILSQNEDIKTVITSLNSMIAYFNEKVTEALSDKFYIVKRCDFTDPDKEETPKEETKEEPTKQYPSAEIVYPNADTQTRFRGVFFPPLNKENCIEDYQSQIKDETDFSAWNVAIIEYFVKLNAQDYDKFCHNLINDCEFLKDSHGGSRIVNIDTLKDIQDEDVDYTNTVAMHKKRMTWATVCIEVMCEETNQRILVDNEGFSYARYVGFLNKVDGGLPAPEATIEFTEKAKACQKAVLEHIKTTNALGDKIVPNTLAFELLDFGNTKCLADDVDFNNWLKEQGMYAKYNNHSTAFYWLEKEVVEENKETEAEKTVEEEKEVVETTQDKEETQDVESDPVVEKKEPEKCYFVLTENDKELVMRICKQALDTIKY